MIAAEKSPLIGGAWLPPRLRDPSRRRDSEGECQSLANDLHSRGRFRLAGAILQLSLFVLFLAASVAYSSSQPDAGNLIDAASLANSVSSGAVPFQLLRGYVIVARGALGDLTGCRFMIDTGSNPTIIDRSVARRLGLRIEPASVSQLSGDSKAAAAILPSLTLGPITTNKLPVLVADFSSAQRDLGIQVDAIVGLDVIKARNFAIDYHARKIIFGQLPISTHSVPFDDGPPMITVKAEMEGRPLRLLIDTGEAGIVLFRQTVGSEGGRLRRIVQSDNYSGRSSREEVAVSDLHLGTLYRRRQIAYLVRRPDSVGREFDGLAGPSALGIKQITFDFERDLLSWK